MLSAKPTSFVSAVGAQLTVGNRRRAAGLVNLGSHRCRSLAGRTVRAVLRSDDKSVSMLPQQLAASDGALKPAVPRPGDPVDVRVVLTVRNRIRQKLVDKIENQWEYFVNGVGQGITVQLVSEEIDPDTKSGKRSAEVSVRGFLPRSPSHPSLVEYAANLTVPSGFGHPGAVVITNLHKKEFFLVEIVVHVCNEGSLFFPANSWIHTHNDNPESRILFSNQAYLPSQTPDGLKDLRKDMLVSLCGDGKGERKKFEMIYDYACYNDLGDPEKDADLARPILGGSERPYPRRCRTGRPPTKSDLRAESRIEKPNAVYVPRDETFEEIKQNNFSAGALRALFHNLIPAMRVALSKSDSQFECFSDIDGLYKEGVPNT
ncbi:lipoxygenase 6, chloroplastic [Canna indica]|uniref:Lipoxygenase 6, chloroplastic n=1 Tax=Canna indica TaxID=4628 RepID=A0AAQ3KTU2_9LILI|nr:lipoxygenase 6, chloroplastic [Canna indica]